VKQHWSQQSDLSLDSKDAIDFLRSQGYGELLDAAAATTTASGRINKSAIARLLNLTTDVVRREMEDMIELLKQ